MQLTIHFLNELRVRFKPHDSKVGDTKIPTLTCEDPGVISNILQPVLAFPVLPWTNCTYLISYGGLSNMLVEVNTQLKCS
jgi:hypothetical protein